MTTYDYRPDPPTGHEDPKAQAQRAAGVARDEGKHVGEVARDEAQNVAAEAQQQAKNLVDDARSQIQEQSKSQLESLVSMLQGFGDDLEKMARGEGPGSGIAKDVVTQVSDRAKTFSSQIQGREPGELLDQARDFARRRPGTFLLGALAAGVVAGRLTRGAKEAHDSSSGTGATGTGATGQPGGYTSAQVGTPPTTSTLPSAGPGLTGPTQAGGTAAADPLAGTSTPPADPVYPEGSTPRTTPGSTP
ncbi:hypothetical protein [Nocardioides sp. SYSU DS0651]|uniref:hypothetical protein n=1 Tax=Nocardioides sp. SYSU DS0651 TaxID=3415955 RepID=UPI003F4B0750